LDSIWIVDAKSMRFTYQSQSAIYIFGYTREEMVNDDKPFYYYYDAATTEYVAKLLTEKAEQLKRGEIEKLTAQFEAVVIRKDGSSV
jgi:PAS domain-containing protein